MVINEIGKYKITTFKGSVHEIDIVERIGELGVFFRLTGNFVKVKDFKNVEVLCRIDQ